jgi:hypothetical protein
VTTSLDHLVVAGTDLSALVAWWAAASGHQPSTGGSHVGFGTKNALVGLGDSYLELIGPDPDQEQPAQPRPFGIDDLPEHSIRLVTFALSVDDLDDALQHMRSSDVAFGPAQPMSRAKPDGSLLTWRLALPTGFDGVMPFLIEWGHDTAHPSASLGAGCTIQQIEAFHPDSDRLAAALASIDAPCTVQHADRPGLSAVIDTPRGTVEL